MFWILFLIFLLACFSAGATGGLFPPGSWYSSLRKPSWTPPNWGFPVAWTSLYICMSFAGARAALTPDNSLAMALWSLQIALNTLWSPVFFGLKNLKGYDQQRLYAYLAERYLSFWFKKYSKYIEWPWVFKDIN